MNTLFKTLLGQAACLTLLFAAGCASLDLKVPGLEKPPPKASAKNPVIDVLCLWEPAEGTGLDNLPTRGFAGQVLFITPGSAEAAQVDGKVRIYVFDDVGTPEEQQTPIHQFDFDATSWNVFMHKSDLGAAYQVFIPYTRKGDHEAHCVLRVRYESPDGRQVLSKMAQVPLSGKKKEPRPADTGVAKVDGASSTVAAPGTNDRMSPTTLTLKRPGQSTPSLDELRARLDQMLNENSVQPAAAQQVVEPDSTGQAGPIRLRGNIRQAAAEAETN
jgi:hypothetical protein